MLPSLKPHWLKPQCQKTLLVEIPTKNNLTGPNYTVKKSDWLICLSAPPLLKSHWLKPPCQETLLVEIPTKNNLIGLSCRPKKSDWLICPPSWNPIGWNRLVNKSYWSKSRPKITLLGQITGQRNLIGWFAPSLKSHWLEPQCQKTLLVEIPDQK